MSQTSVISSVTQPRNVRDQCHRPCHRAVSQGSAKNQCYKILTENSVKGQCHRPVSQISSSTSQNICPKHHHEVRTMVNCAPNRFSVSFMSVEANANAIELQHWRGRDYFHRSPVVLVTHPRWCRL